MKKINVVFITCIFILMSSCEKDKKDNPNSEADLLLKNNTAILTGSELGNNSIPIEEVWKTSVVDIENPSSEFSAEQVFFSRSSLTSNYTYWILPVKNISDIPLGYVLATGLQYLDANGSVLYEDESNYTYVYGSCGENEHLITSSFLRPGETGYFLGIDQVNFDQVKSLRLSAIEKSLNPYEYSSAKVIPQSYQVSDHNLNVTVKNTGDRTVILSFSPCMFLDNMNRPMSWTYLAFDDLTVLEKTMTVNSTAILTTQILTPFSCNKIQPLLSFTKEYVKKSTENYTGTWKDEFFRTVKKARDFELMQAENN